MNPVHPWLDADEVRRLAEQLLQPPPQQDVRAMENAGFGTEFVGFAENQPAAAGSGFPSPSPPVAITPRPIVPPQMPPSSPLAAVTVPSLPIVPSEPATAAPSIRPPVPITAPASAAVLPPLTPSPAPSAPEPHAAPSLSEPASQAVPAAHTTTDSPATPHRSNFLERIRQYRDWMHSRFSANGLFILDREGNVIFDEGTHGRLHFLARSLALASRRPEAAATNVHVKIGVGATLEVIPVDTPFGCLVLGAIVPDALNQDAVHLIMQGLIQTIRHPDAQAT